MNVGRRNLIKLLSFSPLFKVSSLLAQNATINTLLSCYDDPQGKHYLGLFNQITGDMVSLPLTHRGHGLCLSPDKKYCLIFARRPGTILWVVDLIQQKIIQQINSQPDRHFYGHGIFSPLGSYLYVAENNYVTGQGVIGIYDAYQHYQRIGEFNSQGIGPHELAFLADKKTLVVANGGIKTHPDLGRAKLNLETMQANLAYFDTQAVAGNNFIAKYSLPDELHQLSIRHISVGIDDTICIAMQYQGAKNHYPPLLALHQGKGNLILLKAPKQIHKKMKNYCGSICHDPSGQYFALSSPRGGLVSFWKNNGTFLHHLKASDACGLAMGVNKGEIYVSTGHGQLINHQIIKNSSTFIKQSLVKQPLVKQQSNYPKNWDNHMLSFT